MLQCWMLSVPLCIAFLDGTKIRTRRSFTCSIGMPLMGLRSTYKTNSKLATTQLGPRFPRPTLVGTEMVSDAFSFSRRSVSSAMIRLASTYGASLWARGSFSATDEVENDARALQGKTKVSKFRLHNHRRSTVE